MLVDNRTKAFRVRYTDSATFWTALFSHHVQEDRPVHISASQPAKAVRLPRARVEGILRKKRRVAQNIALRLAKVFGTSAQFWPGLQMDYDLEEEQQNLSSKLKEIHQFQEINVV